jgi:ankyrin repeat protein
LISEGVDTNATSNIDGVTALMLASREGHKGIAVDLIEAGADASAVSGNGWSALLFAAAAGRRDTSAILLQRGSVDVNAVDKRSGGISALTVASRSGQTAVVRLLVDLGATIDRETLPLV